MHLWFKPNRFRVCSNGMVAKIASWNMVRMASSGKTLFRLKIDLPPATVYLVEGNFYT